MSDIATLFATDPLKLSEADLETIIKKFRENRALYVQAGKGSPRVTEAKADKAEGKAKAKAISLDDLGL